MTNSKRATLSLVSNNAAAPASSKPTADRSRFKLIVNEGFSKHSVMSAQQLAGFVEREFMRLTVDCSIAKASSVRLDYVPDARDLQTAVAVLQGRGFYVETQRIEPQLKSDEPYVSIWLEKRSQSQKPATAIERKAPVLQIVAAPKEKLPLPAPFKARSQSRYDRFLARAGNIAVLPLYAAGAFLVLCIVVLMWVGGRRT